MSYFFDSPSRSYQIRELARLTKIPKTTLSKYMQKLLSQRLILKEKKGLFYSYKSNNSDFYYRFYKRMWIIEKIYRSGLVSFLEETLYPEVIFLFGSAAKGEFVKESDLDIFVLAPEKKIDLKMFERKLGKKINLLFKDKFTNLSLELSNNIINGHKLSGHLKLR